MTTAPVRTCARRRGRAQRTRGVTTSFHRERGVTENKGTQLSARETGTRAESPGNKEMSSYRINRRQMPSRRRSG